MMAARFEVSVQLCLLFICCLIPTCLSSTVYKYLTTVGRHRIVEVDIASDGTYLDCAVFADQLYIQETLSNVPADHIKEIPPRELNHSVSKCHDLHLTLKDSPLRRKRGLNMIYPGTKWCGKSDIASNFTDLGRHNYTDACCRDHDHCHDCIAPWSWKYGLFNSALYYKCDCSCDDEFYKCLKESPDEAASDIGKVFFNILGTDCFKDAHPQTCVETWFWFFCERYEEDTTQLVKKFVDNPEF